jgi:hypothetical protein
MVPSSPEARGEDVRQDVDVRSGAIRKERM